MLMDELAIVKEVEKYVVMKYDHLKNMTLLKGHHSKLYDIDYFKDLDNDQLDREVDDIQF